MNKIKKTGLLLASIALVFTACGQKDFVTTKTGLTYKKVEDGSGEKPKDGDFVLMNIAYYGPNGDKIFSSADRGSALPLNYVDSMFTENGSLEEGFRLCGKGDSFVFKIKAKPLFEKSFRTSLPDTLDADSEITINLGVDNVLSPEQFQKYRQDEMLKARARAEEEAKKQKVKDLAEIDTYLEENGIEAETTEEGLRYVITQEGSGAKPEAGQTVAVNYTGKLLDGTMFDSSIESVAKEGGVYQEGRQYDKPLEFPLGKGRVIKGWDIGIALLNKGAKATLYVPSGLGYGPRRAGAKIGPNSILIFDVELIDIK